MVNCVRKENISMHNSVALDESTDVTDTAQLAIYVRGVDDKFEVMEELLKVTPMHGHTTAQDIFRQLCDAIVECRFIVEKIAGITTDGAPSMTGNINGLVYKENWKRRVWKRPLFYIALSISRPFAANA